MPDSLAEIRAVLAEVSQRLHTAQHCARSAGQRIAEAAVLLADLDTLHHEALLPPELVRAGEELARVLELISGGVDGVAALDARL